MNKAELRDAVAAVTALRHEDRLDDAEAAIGAILQSHPKNRLALIEGAYLAWCRKDWSLAAKRYDALAAAFPQRTSEKVHRRAGRSWLNLKRPNRAAESLRLGLARFPDDLNLVALSVKADLARGQGEAAMAYLAPYIQASGVSAYRIHAAFHRLLFRRGYARTAYEIKEKCAEVYTAAERPRNAREKLQRAAASVYLGDFETARSRILSENYQQWPRPSNAEQLRRYCDLMVGCDPAETFRALYEAEGEPEILAPTAPDHWSREDFRRHIAGRSVAVVGPADTRQDLRQEIDGFDLVVRNNVFAASDMDFSADLLGRRVDISYYTAATFFRRNTELLEFARDSGIIPVLRRATNLVDARAAGLVKARVCSASPPNFVPNFNNMHSIQRILWDLLKFGPSRIKLFNVTFYAGNMYSPGYRPRNVTPSLKSLGLSHDPLQGFRFTRNMMRRGIIECDPVAASILEWPEERYIELLQTDYASHWRRGPKLGGPAT